MTSERTLTRQQRDLLDTFWETKVTVPIRRREGLAGGGFRFYDVVREVRPIDFRVHPDEFVFKLHETRPDAHLSPVKVNLRDLPETVVEQTAQVLKAVRLDQELDLRPDFCAGIPNAGTPLAEAYSRATGIPLIDIFRKKESNGGRTIEAYDLARMGNSSTSVLIIDDVLTEGGSKLEAASVTGELGYKVAGVLVLVDREEGGRETLAQKNIKLLSAFPLRRAIHYYWETNRVNNSQYENYLGYLRLVRR